MSSHLSTIDKSPFTAALANDLLSQRAYIDPLLRARGIDESCFGSDMEFSLQPNTDLSSEERRAAEEAAKRLRQRVLDDLRIKGGDSDANLRLREAERFNTAELIMYELHDLEPRTRGILRPLFGTGRDDLSYYDGVGILEVKIQHASSEEFLRRMATVESLLQEKAVQYGFKPPRFSKHLSMSFWRDGKNLLDPLHPEFTTTGARIVTGVQKAVCAAEMCLRSSFGLLTSAGTLGPDRTKDLRLTGEGEEGRLELRFKMPQFPKDIPFLIEAVLKPGAAYGLMHDTEVQMAKRGAFHRKGNDFELALHVLQGSQIEPTENSGVYKLAPPDTYITNRMFCTNNKTLCDELGFTLMEDFEAKALGNADPRVLTQKCRQSTPEAYLHQRSLAEEMSDADPLKAPSMQFHQQVHVQKGKVVWPADEVIEGYYRTLIDTMRQKGVVTDELPKIFHNTHLVERNGTYDIAWPEKDRRQIGNTTYPFGIPRCDTLKDAIVCKGIVPTMAHPGYPVTERFKTLPGSPVFNDTMHPTLKAHLAAAVTQEVAQHGMSY